MSLQSLMQDVRCEISHFDSSVSQTEVVQAVYEKLRSKGAKTKHLVSNRGELSGPSVKALELFEKGSMAEVRSSLARSGGASASAAAAAGDEYRAVEKAVSYAQATRLVQRSAMMFGHKFYSK